MCKKFKCNIKKLLFKPNMKITHEFAQKHEDNEVELLNPYTDIIISNSRHYEALIKALRAIEEVNKGLVDNISGDLLSVDIRRSINHLSEITGEITNDDVLGNIFANFCIGK